MICQSAGCMATIPMAERTIGRCPKYTTAVSGQEEEGRFHLAGMSFGRSLRYSWPEAIVLNVSEGFDSRDTGWLTVLQSSHNGQYRRVESVSVVVDTHDVDVYRPDCFARCDAQRSRWQCLGPIRQLNETERGKMTHETIRSFSQFDNVCASSEGGPGLNFGEQIAGKSIFGTDVSYVKMRYGSAHQQIHVLVSRC